MLARKAAETKRPLTVEDHRELDRIHVAKKTTAVSDALRFPDGEAFEADLTALLSSDVEASGETVAITNAMPATRTLNSCIRSTMPLAVPPPRRKSSTISAFWFSRTARRLRLIISIFPDPDT